MTDGILEAIETDLAGMQRVTSIVGATKGSSGDVHRSLLAQLALKNSEQRADDTTLVSLEMLAEPTRSRRPNLHPTI
jgi:serine phosphatase RsbU (regulator of sigma subunit)